MVILPQCVKDAIQRNPVKCIATADENGIPNVVYVAYLTYINDDTIMIADNKFVKTRNNLNANPALSFVVLDEKTRKSYQVKGTTHTYRDGEKYETVVKWVHEKHNEMTPHAAVYLQVESVYCGAEQLA